MNDGINDHASAKTRWAKFCRKLDLSGSDVDSWMALSKLHSTPPRAYHNLKHVWDCLEQLDTAPPLSDTERDCIEMAIWWHDSVYDSRSDDNEAKSAEQFTQFATTAGVKLEMISEVKRLIICTQHKVPANDPSRMILQDIDLSILGREQDVFDTYEKQIREEYDWVSECDYRKGRSEFLRGLEKRPSIFLTKPFQDRYERQARLNLKRLRIKLSRNDRE